jgi:transcriptional regulator with XRE-family HTH domain
MTAVAETALDAEQAWLCEVGMRVRMARTRQRQSQAGLGVRAGVSRVTVGSIERGDHPASVLAYARLAGACGLLLGELLDGSPLNEGAGRLAG